MTLSGILRGLDDGVLDDRVLGTTGGEIGKTAGGIGFHGHNLSLIERAAFNLAFAVVKPFVDHAIDNSRYVRQIAQLIPARALSKSTNSIHTINVYMARLASDAVLLIAFKVKKAIAAIMHFAILANNYALGSQNFSKLHKR